MMNISSRIYRKLLLVALLISSLVSSAKFPGFFSHLEIGYSYPIATAKFEGYNYIYNYSGGSNFGLPVDDTFVSRTVSSKFAYGAFTGSSIRLKRTGVQSALALNVAIMANAYVWEDLYKAFTYTGEEYDMPDNLVAIGLQYGAPISIDFKYGAGALGSKNPRLTTGFGVGVMPAAYFMVAENNGNVGGAMSFTATPFAKAEVGIMAGICVKVRALVSFGAVPWIDNDKSFLAGTTGGSFKVTGQTNAVLSFIIMPFSWAWRREGWYDNDFKFN